MATTRYIVNNVTGQTINGQSVTPSYKVYTALLTQSGGDTLQNISSGNLTIGVTYVINKGKGKVDTGDFTNVGAPNNNDGTYFVATGTTPNEWGESELEYNEGAPVVTVLENTIGYIYWTYSSGNDGVYYGNLNLRTGFPLDKTYYSVNSRFSDDGGASAYDAFLLRSTDDFFVLSTWSGGISSNSLIAPNNPLSIEIRVYN